MILGFAGPIRINWVIKCLLLPQHTTEHLHSSSYYDRKYQLIFIFHSVDLCVLCDYVFRSLKFLFFVGGSSELIISVCTNWEYLY